MSTDTGAAEAMGAEAKASETIDKWRARRLERQARAAERSSRDGIEIGQTIDRLLQRIEAERAEWTALPCDELHRLGHIGDAVTACEKAGALPTCQMAKGSECPRQIEAAPWELAERRLRDGRVPEDPAGRLLAAMPRRLREGDPPPESLMPTDALRLVRALIARKARLVEIDCSPEPITFLGHERILVLGGDVGVGKSLAAGWAIREHGGIWLHAEEFEQHEDRVVREGRASLRLNARRSSLVVLDDIGEEHTGAGRFASGEIASFLTALQRSTTLAIVTTNMEREEFAQRYGARVNDRLNGCGRWMSLVGPSLRGRA